MTDLHNYLEMIERTNIPYEYDSQGGYIIVKIVTDNFMSRFYFDKNDMNLVNMEYRYAKNIYDGIRLGNRNRE